MFVYLLIYLLFIYLFILFIYLFIYLFKGHPKTLLVDQDSVVSTVTHYELNGRGIE